MLMFAQHIQQMSFYTNPAQIQCLDEAAVSPTCFGGGHKTRMGQPGLIPTKFCPRLLPLDKAEFAQGLTAYLSGIWIGLEECSILISSC